MSITFTVAYRIHHEYPAQRAHVVEDTATPHDLVGVRCWCAPTFSALCGQCDGAGCWHCADGWRAVDADEAVCGDVPTLVFHR